jgi:hypothetical protein
MLSEAEVDTQLSALPLREGIDPTQSGLTGGDLLILYFAWLTDLSEKALQMALDATSGKFEGDPNALDNSHTRGNLHRTRYQRLPAGRVLIHRRTNVQ